MYRKIVIVWVCVLQSYGFDCLTRTLEAKGFRGVDIYSSVSSNWNMPVNTLFGCLRFCSLLHNCSVVSYERENSTCVVSTSMQATSDGDEPDESVETYIKQGGGSFYLLDLTRRNFSNAVNNCVARGGHLVYVKTENVRITVKQLLETEFGPSIPVWIGARRSPIGGMFNWLDGTAVDSLLWSSGQPDNPPGVEDCVATYSYYYLNNVHCTMLGRSVCEFTF